MPEATADPFSNHRKRCGLPKRGPGRPKGSRNRATRLLDQIGTEGAERVLRKVLELAEAGDLRAAELVLARLWPARRGRPVALDLPPIRTAADLVPALTVVAAAMAAGAITPDEAQGVAGVLETQRRAAETADLEARVAALEARRGEAGA
jgi:hypothetical protein